MTDTPTIYTAHDVPDLINSLPTLFGFTPTESLVAIATHGERCRFGFRLRVDIPDEGNVRPLAALVVHHLRRQGAEGAVLIAVTERQDVAARLLDAIERRLSPVELVVAVRATATHYWTTDAGFPADGVPYARSGHHLSIVTAVVAGQEILPDRQALVDRFRAADGPRRELLLHATEEVLRHVIPQIGRAADDDLAVIGMREVGPILERGSTTRLDDADVVRLSVWVSATAVRDAVWARITRENAGVMLGLLTQASRSVVPPFEPAILSLAAFAAWLTGDGAQALIAVERALEADPQYSMAGLILQLLEGGVSPSHWSGIPADHDQSP
ncbi:MAG: hypothetical protein JWQ70_1048 [Aeromicrobium sp.]|nr:hypothetical protein [Aeromicrobium sp.]